jgi:hypothetical protein
MLHSSNVLGKMYYLQVTRLGSTTNRYTELTGLEKTLRSPLEIVFPCALWTVMA